MTGYGIRDKIKPNFLNYVILQREEIDSEEDRNIDLSRTIPSGTNKSLPILDSVLTGLSDRFVLHV